MSEENPRTEQEIRDSIKHHKKSIRHIEILFVVMSVLAVTLFSMIAWKNGIFNILLFAITIIAACRLWMIATDWEVSKFFDELELLKFTNKNEENEDEKIS